MAGIGIGLPVYATLADIDREAGVYDPVEDEYWCSGCMLQLTVMGPDGVPEDEFCDECRAEIEAEGKATR